MPHARAESKQSSSSSKDEANESTDSGTVSVPIHRRQGPLRVGGPAIELESQSTPVSSPHRTVGNQAVQRLYEKDEIQTTLSVSQPGDATEREAERVASAVTGEEPELLRAGSGPGRVHRRLDGREKTVGDTTEATIESITTGGQSLPDRTRQTFEGRFGRDFGDVRVHTGTDADSAARAIEARAFTYGSDVVFRAGAYDPDSTSGRRLLAHELTHVVQQGGARRVDRQDAGMEDRDAGQAQQVGQNNQGAQQNQGGGGGNRAIVRAAINRATSDVADSYDWSPGWWYSPNPDLDGAHEEPIDFEQNQGAQKKDGEYIVNWGDGQQSCNTFVYDALYQAGYDRFRMENDHYYDASQTHNGARGNLTRVQRANIQPGDIFTNGRHMELITAVRGPQDFDTAAGHREGASHDQPSNYAENDDLRFWRV